MHMRLYLSLEQQKSIFPSQFGFQKNKSTMHSLIEIVEKIKYCIEEKKYGCGIFIDLKKAFDIVNHNILLNKLEHYGVRVKVGFHLIRIIDHNLYLIIFISSETCGVPQGSVLGPLLFLIYINDLPNISNKLQFFLFADDTNIFFESPNLHEIEKTVNKELKKLNMWLNANRLALNVSKTNFVIFAPVNKPMKIITIRINKQAISQKDYVKHLGVLIDSRLTFQQHISSIKKKVSRTISIMYKLRHFVNKKVLFSIYYSLIYPFLIYAIPVWGVANDSHINPIEVLQKKIVRMITVTDKLPRPPGPLAHT